MFFIGPHQIDHPFLLAPMAGVSEMPFRVLALEMGAGLATTELVSAKGLFHNSLRSQQYLTYDKAKEKPYSVQLFGGEDVSMAKAAELAAKNGAQIIDVNMGCPVKKVTKTGAGSALMCDPSRAQSLIKNMREAVGDAVPITAKIRTGWDESSINCVTMAKALEDAGCAAVALHGRTRAQGYSGKADWSQIKAIKEAVRIPVIGNGDVVTIADGIRMKEETGCDAVMIGRGALGNPWIFGSPPTSSEKLSIVLRHLREHIAFHGMFDQNEAATLRAIRSFRSHLVWYSRGLKDASIFRERIMTIEDATQLEDQICAFFSRRSETDIAAPTEWESVDYRQAFG